MGSLAEAGEHHAAPDSLRPGVAGKTLGCSALPAPDPGRYKAPWT